MRNQVLSSLALVAITLGSTPIAQADPPKKVAQYSHSFSQKLADQEASRQLVQRYAVLGDLLREFDTNDSEQVRRLTRLFVQNRNFLASQSPKAHQWSSYNQLETSFLSLLNQNGYQFQVDPIGSFQALSTSATPAQTEAKPAENPHQYSPLDRQKWLKKTRKSLGKIKRKVREKDHLQEPHLVPYQALVQIEKELSSSRPSIKNLQAQRLVLLKNLKNLKLRNRYRRRLGRFLDDLSHYLSSH